jgi:NAD-dependent dihydropyrimidine dehydrogenase PreA subunit
VKNFVILGVGLVMITTAMALFIKYQPFEQEDGIAVRDEMHIRHIAERNDVPIDVLIPLLPPEMRTDRVTTLLNLHKPVKDLGLAKDEIANVVRTAQAGGFSSENVLRYVLWSVWLLVAGCLLLRGKNLRRIRIVWLVATLTVFGLLLGAAPNPMEAVVKFHKLLKAIPGNPLIFVVLNLVIFTLLSVVGAKMLCSWGCQLGALQETLYNLPVLKNVKRKLKIPFPATIAVRITVYLLFLVLFFKLVNINQGGPGSILYHHFNMFKIFELYDLALFTLLLIPFVLIASLVVFRPFCHLICPFGLYSWLLENVAVYRVRRVKTDQCHGCRKCEEVCPTDAMKAIHDDEWKHFLPDCWSCGSCIDACPENVLQFTSCRRIDPTDDGPSCQ